MEDAEETQTNAMAWVGQVLAYLGVLGLTLGSGLVLWSYFGGPDRYAPTGWLITTASQMLLFLGVITLISGGLEQTTRVLTRRLDRLGDRLLRFEQAAQHPASRGPFVSSTRDRAPETSSLDAEAQTKAPAGPP
ncbi:MAG TPA: hypothetical protein EYP14_03530 [Planctomycetaceae bacterium]|nr:hypothetical protein [Planctomycetaceae bacterium]